jgi:hypothetical protein
MLWGLSFKNVWSSDAALHGIDILARQARCTGYDLLQHEPRGRFLERAFPAYERPPRSHSQIPSAPPRLFPCVPMLALAVVARLATAQGVTADSGQSIDVSGRNISDPSIALNAMSSGIITGASTSLTTTGAFAVGANSVAGGQVSLSGGTIAGLREGSFGLLFNGSGAISVQNVSIAMSGSHGNVGAGGAGPGRIDLSCGSIMLQGLGDHGVQIEVGGTITVTGVSVVATGANSLGGLAHFGGILHLSGSTFRLDGSASRGLAAEVDGSIFGDSVQIASGGTDELKLEPTALLN